jgi:hypothetical protein
MALFDKNGKPIAGDFTAQVELYEAGTEVNQAPRAGPDQAPRQSKPNTGASEHKAIAPVITRYDDYTYPSTSAVIEVFITPVAAVQPQS